MDAAATSAAPTASAWAPLRNRVFAVLWGATLVGNVGTWMRDVGAGWLMTDLSPSPGTVALVQAAAALPVFLLSLPAGALADLLDKRRLLIAVQLGLLAVSATLAAVTWAGLVSPALLVTGVLLAGVGAAMMGPAWQAVVPALVPKPQLRPAVALNSLGINIARAIGPALGGAIVATAGAAAAFAADALTYLVVIAALLWWRPAARAASGPREQLLSATVAAWRYARGSAPLRRVLLRAFLFFLSASASWALLPLIARRLLQGNAGFYGLLLAGIGAGAVAGALLLPALRARLGTERLVCGATLLIASVALVLAAAPPRLLALALMPLFGLGWIAVLTSLNVAAQGVLPDWVRARGLAVYLTVFSGGMALGSFAWGQTAQLLSIPAALGLAGGGGALVALAMLARPLPTGEDDLQPSHHWPDPVAAVPAADDAGPVLVTVEYCIEPGQADAMLAALRALGATRRRDGAYQWGAYRDVADPTRIVEWFQVESWAEHLRQHARVTRADEALQAQVRALHRGSEPPLVRHLLGLHEGEAPPPATDAGRHI